jgi:hypothetical protein
MCRSTKGRQFYRILGRPTASNGVDNGNCMVSRVMLLFALAALRGLIAILEQPESSIMVRHPHFQWLLNLINIFRVRVELGLFGAASQKPIHLYCTHALIGEITNYYVRDWFPPSDTYTVKHDGQVSGTTALKGSENYPIPFGVGVAQLYSEHHTTLVMQGGVMRSQLDAQITLDDLCAHDDGSWEGARLSAAIERLMEMVKDRVDDQ